MKHDPRLVIDLIEEHLPPSPPPSPPADLTAELKRQADMLRNPPPTPHVIIARHDVPYGHAYSYYDTEGRWIVYANRGELADLPRVSGERIGIMGIPVVIE